MRDPDVKSDQGNFLKGGDPGVCNALVLQWLGGGGVPLKLKRRGAVRQAVKVHEKGVNLGTFTEYLLTVRDPDHDLSIFRYPLDDDRIYAFLSKPGMYVIGMYGANDGHAIGAIQQGQFKGYDPNEGFWNIKDEAEYSEWLEDRISEYFFRYNYTEVYLYRATSCHGNTLARVFGAQ